jgi:hypothetical protein
MGGFFAPKHMQCAVARRVKATLKAVFAAINLSRAVACRRLPSLVSL